MRPVWMRSNKLTHCIKRKEIRGVGCLAIYRKEKIVTHRTNPSAPAEGFWVLCAIKFEIGWQKYDKDLKR